ncbi:MAG: MBL fold metallo-hydrolase [Eubacteriales bacterium]|nr:MBL fold metallo-hydrolase [Eubacteriales bacterium]
MKVHILTDNQCKLPHLKQENGVSILVETKKHTILIDAGQSDVFMQNAEAMGLDLQKVDVCCLSHGHYDHCNGILHFLNVNKHAKVYASSDIFGKYYNINNEYVGVSPELKKHKDRFVFVDADYFIDESIYFFTGNDRQTVNSIREIGYTAKSNGLMEPDDFHHELYVVIGDGKKKIVVSGCTHKGINNVLYWARHENISAFIGGIRFGNLSFEVPKQAAQLQQAVADLKRYNVKYFAMHCRADSIYRHLEQELTDKFYRVTVGESFEI